MVHVLNRVLAMNTFPEEEILDTGHALLKSFHQNTGKMFSRKSLSKRLLPNAMAC